MTRPEISDDLVDMLIGQLQQHLRTIIKKKGREGFVSSHETSGCIDEELNEFKAAVHANDRERVKAELYDIMIAAFWGIASEEAGGWDW